MQQIQLVNEVRNATSEALALVEQAQAKAAAIVQEYTKLGGATFLVGFDWEQTDVTETQVANAINSLQNMADILGGHGVNLYPLKR
jgi:hypothetical protein